jgi:hypothetical protein
MDSRRETNKRIGLEMEQTNHEITIQTHKQTNRMIHITIYPYYIKKHTHKEENKQIPPALQGERWFRGKLVIFFIFHFPFFPKVL